MERRKFLRRLAGGIALPVTAVQTSRRCLSSARPAGLEIIASSLDDALAAYHGGASSLEIAVRLDQGGITPPVRMVEAIVGRVPIVARVMLRENSGFTLRGREELEKLKADAQRLAKLRIDGLITGYVKAGRLDLETLRQIADAVPTTRFTIHNAIEMTEDPLEALRSLRGFTRVDKALITGGKGNLPERVGRVPAYEAAFGPGRSLVLGNLRLQDLGFAYRSTDIQTFHVGLAARTPPDAAGAVDVKKVREARRLLSG
ncbi:MAG TPA: copper homeostasis protein CutC [Terriglobia bacterium]|nr:copper homeostasis protein CutC [Terriglobia bacterium]